jgi:hypothetical protein
VWAGELKEVSWRMMWGTFCLWSLSGIVSIQPLLLSIKEFILITQPVCQAIIFTEANLAYSLC